MNMSWLESLIYGLISGISEFLPISSFAHQQILLHLFGTDGRDPVRDFFVHLGMLIAVIAACRSFMDLLKRGMNANSTGRYTGVQNNRAFMDWKLIRSALFPVVIGMFFLRYIFKFEDNLVITSLFLVTNGVIVFLPNRIIQGNKTASSMSAMDGVLIGSSGALSVFPGISRVACTYGVSVVRGAARKSALLWTLILSIYALACLCLMDLISVFAVGEINFWANLFTYILSGLSSYAGSYLGIYVMRFLAGRPSGNGFAYYCWGASLFSFILYLTVA